MVSGCLTRSSKCKSVTNFDASKRIKLPDSRFTVIFLDKLNKNKNTTQIYSLSKLRFEPGAYSSLKRYRLLHIHWSPQSKFRYCPYGGQRPLHSPCRERPGNWRSVIGPSSWRLVAPLTTEHAVASLCKSITWGTLFKSSVYARECVRVYMRVCN